MTGFAVGDRVTLVNVASQVGQEFEGAACTIVRSIDHAAIYGGKLFERPHYLVKLDSDGLDYYIDACHLRPSAVKATIAPAGGSPAPTEKYTQPPIQTPEEWDADWDRCDERLRKAGLP